ncbi:Guanylate kinase [bioreactor metagenome]|uniref:Guanylate kinase n=1 Tax=bioreactor metagenome TaxID=1076179 RepID=A0A644SVC7_9ZZZZ|nr:guanylate kinase [Negativicutes bacterium]
MNNKLYAIIGPPGSGKTTIVKRLKDFGIPVLVSHTTRPPKSNEKAGHDYYFVDQTTFSNMVFLEKVLYANNLYGLTKDEVLNKVHNNPISIVEIERNGLEQLKNLLGVRLESIYILVDKNTLIERYVDQGEKFDSIKQRIKFVEENNEFNNWQIADHVVKNTNTIDITVRQILAIMGMTTIK